MKIHRLVLLLTLSFSLFNLDAQIFEKDSVVQVVAYWSLGESHTYKYEKNIYTIQGEDTLAWKKNKFDYIVTVTDSTDGSYTLKCQYKNVERTSSNPLDNRMDSWVNDSLMNTVIIKTDENGTFQSLENLEEVEKDAIKIAEIMTDSMWNMLPDSTKNVMSYEKLRETMALISDKKTLLPGVTEEISMLLFYHGGRYDMTDTYSMEEEYPNYFGKDPLPGKKEFWVDDYDTEDGVIEMQSYGFIDADNAIRSYFSALKNMVTEEIPPIPSEEIPVITGEDNMSVWINVDYGWTLYLIMERLFVVGNRKNVVDISLELVE